jgi:hypothetical protein
MLNRQRTLMRNREFRPALAAAFRLVNVSGVGGRRERGLDVCDGYPASVDDEYSPGPFSFPVGRGDVVTTRAGRSTVKDAYGSSIPSLPTLQVTHDNHN